MTDNKFYSFLKNQEVPEAAIDTLVSAKEKQKITSREITEIMPESIARNRAKFTTIITKLREFLESHNVEIVTGQEAIEKEKERKQSREKSSQTSIPNRDTVPEPSQTKRQEAERMLDRYYDELEAKDRLPRHKEYKLSRRWLEEGDTTARDKLVTHNLRLVFWMVQKYDWANLSEKELVQEGITGLITAANRYDYREDTRFGTYAYYWVRYQIQRAIENYARTVRVPVNRQKAARRIKQAVRKLTQKLGRDPTMREVVRETGEKPKLVKDVLQGRYRQASSLDEKRSTEDDRTGYDVFSQQNTTDPTVRLEAKEKFQDLLEKLQKLKSLVLSLDAKQLSGKSQRNKDIFLKRYGMLEDLKIRVYEDIEEEYPISWQRIRQVIEQMWGVLYREGTSFNHSKLKEAVEKLRRLARFLDKEVVVSRDKQKEEDTSRSESAHR